MTRNRFKAIVGTVVKMLAKAISQTKSRFPDVTHRAVKADNDIDKITAFTIEIFSDGKCFMGEVDFSTAVDVFACVATRAAAGKGSWVSVRGKTTRNKDVP